MSDQETQEQRDQRVREMLALAGDPKQFTEPVTEEEIAASKRHAVEMMAQSAAILTEDERALDFAIRREQNARANIEVVSDELIAAWFTTDHSRIDELKEAAATLNMALARALRDQGRLDEAIAVVPEYAEKLEVGRRAIDRPDDWECDCADPVLTLADGSQRVVSKWQPLKRIWSARHGGAIFYLQCSVCGEYNATPTLPARLFAQMAVAKDPKYAPEGKGPDHEVMARA